ncbi:MAG TPA: rRNA maturation RNase YbeY [Candidatus Faecousia intestinigallinarum]|nr:rRNA maturation RNase YbeY [Candidatus Faecousia intestinigallinarum]
MKHKVTIAFDRFSLGQEWYARIIRRCIQTALEEENIHVPCEINVLITNDQGIQGINKATRDLDKPTDVLSFPMFSLVPGAPPKDWREYLDPETGLVPLGDMCISLERAVRQAREFGHSTRREVGYLTIHSVLHLLGYDHLDEGAQKAQMRGREEAIAAKIPGLKRK